MPRATREGTAQFAKDRAGEGLGSDVFRTLGRTGLTTSTLGFGCYRIGTHSIEHGESLEAAIRQGCNLIDTSTNYGDGDSETCVGQIVGGLVQGKQFKREELIVVSKVGYVQGKNLELARSRQAIGKDFPEMVKYNDDCWHCIHPEFIADQISRSLMRLKLDHIDVMLLHNPEYFFSDIQHRGGDATAADKQDEFYARIKAAFRHLEGEVNAGRIGSYGVSSNTFVRTTNDPERTSLDRMWEIARGLGQEFFGDADKHHFSVIQFPFNLFEGGAALEKNHADGKQTVLESAREKKLGVLINRPLNAILENHLFRLADYHNQKNPQSIPNLSDRAIALEKDFAATIAPNIQTEPGSSPATEFFRWAQELNKTNLENIAMEQWQQIEHQVIVPQVRYMTETLNEFMVGNLGQKWEEWRNRYLPALQDLLQAHRSVCASRSQKMSDTVSEKLNPLLPGPVRQFTLSQKSLATLIHTEGVTCVLNGMRRLEYVEDSLGAWKIAPFTATSEIYETFRVGADEISN